MLLAAGVAYAGLVALVRRRSVPGATLLIALGLGMVARLVLVASPPLLSTDLYRYVWTGECRRQGSIPIATCRPIRR